MKPPPPAKPPAIATHPPTVMPPTGGVCTTPIRHVRTRYFTRTQWMFTHTHSVARHSQRMSTRKQRVPQSSATSARRIIIASRRTHTTSPLNRPPIVVKDLSNKRPTCTTPAQQPYLRPTGPPHSFLCPFPSANSQHSARPAAGRSVL
jgi:hypothetical protein